MNMPYTSKINECVCGANEPTNQLNGNITQESAGRITQVAFADTPKEAEITIFYMKKYEQLKEVIQNMVDRLDEHGEILLRKDSIIVLALKEAIK